MYSRYYGNNVSLTERNFIYTTSQLEFQPSKSILSATEAEKVLAAYKNDAEILLLMKLFLMRADLNSLGFTSEFDSK